MLRSKYTIEDLRGQDYFPTISNQEKNKLNYEKRVAKKPVNMTVREFTRKFTPEEVDQMKVALAYISPDLPYEEWRNLIFAIHHVASNSDLTLPQAEALAIDWSSGQLAGITSETYQKEGKQGVTKLWNSISDDNPNPSTLGTIIYHAKQDPNYERYVQTNGYSLQIIGDPTLRSPEATALEHALSTYAKVSVSGRTVYVQRAYPPNSQQSYSFLSPSALKDWMANQRMNVPAASGKMKEVSVFEPFIQDTRLKQFQAGTEFMPIPGMYISDHNEQEIVDPNPQAPSHAKKLNLFLGFSHKPAPDSYLLNKIQSLVFHGAAKGDAAISEYIHNFAAHMVQHPDRKMPILITLVGSKGSGKSQLASIIRSTVHPYSFVTDNYDGITGRFSGASLESAICIQLEEVTWARNNKENSRLKHLITSTSINVERKGISVEHNKPVFYNLIGTANEGLTAPQGTKKDERRYLTVDFSNHFTGNKAFWDSLGEDVDVGVPGTLRYKLIAAYVDFLLKRDISSFDPRELPDVKSDAAARNRESQQSTRVNFLFSAADDGELVPPADSMLVQRETASVNEMFDTHPTHCLVRSKQLISAYADFEKQQTIYHKIGTVKFAAELKRDLYDLTGDGLLVDTSTRPSIKDIQDYPDHLIKGHKYIRIPSRKALESIYEEFIA